MQREIGNILVAGIGGVGGYFGGRIAAGIAAGSDKKGQKVYFLARGAHLQAIQRNGLLLKPGQGAELRCRPELASDKLEQIPSPDLVLVSVKSYDLAGLAAGLSGIITGETVIIPLLNGVDIYERIREILPKAVVLPAGVYVSANIAEPGVVVQRGKAGTIFCGPDPEHGDHDYQHLASFFRDLDINFQWYENPFYAIWEKYLFIASFGLVTAYSGRSFGGVLADAGLKELVRQVIEEIIALAQARGIRLKKDAVDEVMNKAGTFPYETRSSYQRDIEAGGRNEGDIFAGTILRFSRDSGVPTPVTGELYQAIERKSRGL
jgi:2-dehydropantoate 2-reductase